MVEDAQGIGRVSKQKRKQSGPRSQYQSIGLDRRRSVKIAAEEKEAKGSRSRRRGAKPGGMER
jgi:hypothetical protein